MNETARYYGRKIASNAVTINNPTLSELIADAAEDSGADLDWGEQGDVHEEIETAVREEARAAAVAELDAAIERNIPTEN